MIPPCVTCAFTKGGVHLKASMEIVLHGVAPVAAHRRPSASVVVCEAR